MVFTHLPSTALLLLLVPLARTPGWAIALLVARASLAQMDVPARQAYIVSVVAGAAIQAIALAVPFVVAGSLKTTYDLALSAGFHSRRGDHELR